MADARAQQLPLLTVGDPEFIEHDWFVMLSGIGVLGHDTQIASAVRVIGWLGMFGVTVWLVWRGWEAAERHAERSGCGHA
jgi:hypothetical protein